MKLTKLCIAAVMTALFAGCLNEGDQEESLAETQQAHSKHHQKKGKLNPGYNLFLFEDTAFIPAQPGSDVAAGRELFGVAAGLQTRDHPPALFTRPSFVAQGVVASNGRTCFDCHRGTADQFGLPEPPLSNTIPPTDPIFTGVNADSGGDPRAPALLDQHGLVKYRPNRFNAARPAEDPYRQVFFWRKSPALLNVGLTHGVLMGGRGRTLREAAQGAVFSHTQDSDDRFDDLLSEPAAHDFSAFLLSLVTDPALAALRDESDPMHDTLMNDPFYTVPIQTKAQRRGRKVFEKACFSCHNTPNVFGNRDGALALGPDGLNPEFPSHAPAVGRTFNVGVSERNAHNLEFTRWTGTAFEPIVLPLANDDGTIENHVVTFDIGLAATTARVADIGRFKVPQLRGIANLAPYFHDNSAATLEEVIDYFDSPEYNQSKDGRHFPIHLNHKQKSDLLEFLLIL